MAKDAYFFPHDYNARNDRKLARLLLTHGVSGIGAYWCVVEMLYEEDGYLHTSDIPAIAKELRMRVKMLQDIIENFELFQQSEGEFFSLAVIARLKKRIARSDSARQSAISRWEKGANAMRTQCERNAIEKRREEDKREEDIKEGIVELPDWISKEIWSAFIEVRKKLRAPLTATATKLIIRKLDLLRSNGDDPNEVLNQSIINAYKGVFPLKGGGNGKTGQSTRALPTTYTDPVDVRARE